MLARTTHLVIGKIKIRLARLVKKKVGRIRYNTKKPREGSLRVRSFCTIQIRIPMIWIFWISCDNGMENLKFDFWSFVI